MSVWAIVKPSGDVRIRYENPAGSDPASTRLGCSVYELDREPDFAAGETVDFSSGEIVFSLASVEPRAAQAIKEEARRRIEAFAPWWKQSNAAREPELQSSIDLFAGVDAIRAWSNDLEAQLADCTTAAGVRGLLADEGLII